MLPGERARDREARVRLQMSLLERENEGRTLGRIAERKKIVTWLRDQGSEACRLAKLIEEGMRTRET